MAQPYALARACASEEVWAEGGIFVDVGGGTTDVALVRDGGVEGTRMFNLGGRAFTRRLALAFGALDTARARMFGGAYARRDDSADPIGQSAQSA